MTINARLKKIRLSTGLNQKAFGARIAVAQTYLSQLENGDRDVTEKILKLICLEFDINEHWLRTGEGEMITPVSREDEIMQFIGRVQGEDIAPAKLLLLALSKLDRDEWKVIDKILDNLAGRTDNHDSHKQ